MTFDEKLKAEARREGGPLPLGFDERMDALLDTLSAGAQPTKKRHAPRTVVCIGIAAALVVSVAAAAPAVLQMARNAISYFDRNQNSEYANYQGKYERFNAAVGMSDTNGGQTLTIDNIAVDDSYLMIFSTLKSETPIELRSGEHVSPSASVEWTAPTFFVEINGELLDTTGPVENEAELVDAYTLTAVQRIALKKLLPDQFDMVLYEGGMSDITQSNFQFAMSVDKSTVAVETLTVKPMQDFTVDISTDYQGETIQLHYAPRIERVSISPFGSSITLSEASADPLTSFVLRDERGNYLPLLYIGSVGGSEISRATNSFEFIGATLDTQSITLIPYLDEGRSHKVEGTLDSLPLTDNSAGGFTLESLDIGAERTVAAFSIRGAVDYTNAQFSLLLANGTPLDRLVDCYMDFTYDRQNALCITTIEYPDATPELLAQVTGVSFWQPNELTLLEDQAVTIVLQ
nr:DUF4179 domain-containing protein [uncultured Agathobaculum sp.]